MEENRQLSELEQDLLRLARIGEEYDEVRNKAKELGELYDELSYRLAMEMKQTGRGSLTLMDMQFIPTEKITAKIEDKVAFMEWVKANNMWDVTHMVSAQKLNGFVNELLAGKQDTPPGVNPGYIKQSISIRRVQS